MIIYSYLTSITISPSSVNLAEHVLHLAIMLFSSKTVRDIHTNYNMFSLQSTLVQQFEHAVPVLFILLIIIGGPQQHPATH